MTYQQIPNQLRSLSLTPNPNEPKDYKGPINCGLPTAKCISNKDLQYEDVYHKRVREGLAELIAIIDEMNQQYMDYLSKPCRFYEFKCKKDRKRTKL